MAQRGIPSRLKQAFLDHLPAAIGKGGELAAHAAGLDPAMASAVGALTEKAGKAVVQDVRSAAEARADAAAQALADEIYARVEASASDEERRKIIEEYTEDPERQQTLFEAWKQLIATPDGAVWPPLVALGIDYWAQRTPVDAFFRDTSALLVACDRSTLEAVGGVLEVLTEAEQLKPGAGVVFKDDLPEPTLMVPFARLPDGSGPHPGFPAPPQTERALRVLAAHGFGFGNQARTLTVRGAAVQLCKRLGHYVRLVPREAP